MTSDRYRMLKPGSIWTHVASDKGYVLLHLANEYATNPEFVPTAVYVDEDNKVWARPAEEFLVKFRPGEPNVQSGAIWIA